MGSRQNRDYEYILETWGIKIAKFLVEMELFPPYQSGGKKIRMSNSLDPDQARNFVGPELGQNCLQRISADDTCRQRVRLV